MNSKYLLVNVFSSTWALSSSLVLLQSAQQFDLAAYGLYLAVVIPLILEDLRDIFNKELVAVVLKRYFSYRTLHGG